jgi:hypothetical protein
VASPFEDKYPWYELVEGSEILQGDFLDHCPVLVPTAEAQLELDGNEEIEAERLDTNVVVMSQSCDLQNKKLDLVLVCPVFKYTELSEQDQYSYLRSSKIKEKLRRGEVPGYHVLRQCEIENWDRPVSLVDFRNVYTVPFVFLERFIGERSPRLRLMPPYREHLSQAFARFFMRVGLPIDVALP